MRPITFVLGLTARLILFALLGWSALSVVLTALAVLNLHPVLFWVGTFNIPVLAHVLLRTWIPTVRLDAAVSFTLAICAGIASMLSVWALATADDSLIAVHAALFAVGDTIVAVDFVRRWHRLTDDQDDCDPFDLI